MKKRIDWIDTAKGIGVFFVTWAWISQWLPMDKFLSSFSMFLFFFLSGYLFTSAGNNMKSFIRKKAKSRLIPFLIWYLLSMPIDLIISDSLSETLFGYLIIHNSTIGNNPVGFFLVLFYAEVLYAFLYQYCSGFPPFVYMMPLCSLITAFLLPHGLLFLISVIPMALFFYSLGFLFRKTRLFRSVYQRWLPVLAVSIAGSLIFSQLNDRISVFTGNFGSPLFCITAGISGVIACCIIAQKLYGFKFKDTLSALGRQSSSALILCYPMIFFIHVFSHLYNELNLTRFINPFTSPFLAVITIIAALSIKTGLRKFMPLVCDLAGLK